MPQGGIYEMKITELLGEWSREACDSAFETSCMYLSRIFDRFEKFSFFAKIGRSKVKKVMKSRISLYKLQWETIRKSWDFGTFFTSDRPNITKNEIFSNRSKIPERYIHEVSNALPHAFQDHLSEKCRNFHFIDPPLVTFL